MELRSNFEPGTSRWATRRAQWLALGLTDEDMVKPKIAIVNSSSQLAICFSHLDEIARRAKRAIEQAGGVAFEVRTAAPSDFITSAGHRGGYILSARDLITNDIEVAVEGALLDGMLCLASCDKTAPGQLMAAARLNIPSIIVACGYQPSGSYRGRHCDIEGVFLAAGHVANGRLSVTELTQMSDHAVLGPGVCAGMGTANTMHLASEALGMALPGSTPVRANSEPMWRAVEQAGARIVQMVAEDLRPRQILTPAAFGNAVTAILSVSGSSSSSGGSGANAANAAGAKSPIVACGDLALSGPYAQIGETDNWGAEAYFDHVNATGGILGHKVDYTVQNNQSSASESELIARKCILSDHAQFIVGPESGADTEAALPIAIAYHTILISLSSGWQTNGYPASELNSWGFPGFYDVFYEDQFASVQDLIVPRHYTRVALLEDNCGSVCLANQGRDPRHPRPEREHPDQRVLRLRAAQLHRRGRRCLGHAQHLRARLDAGLADRRPAGHVRAGQGHRRGPAGLLRRPQGGRLHQRQPAGQQPGGLGRGPGDRLGDNPGRQPRRDHDHAEAPAPEHQHPGHHLEQNPAELREHLPGPGRHGNHLPQRHPQPLQVMPPRIVDTYPPSDGG